MSINIYIYIKIQKFKNHYVLIKQKKLTSKLENNIKTLKHIFLKK